MLDCSIDGAAGGVQPRAARAQRKDALEPPSQEAVLSFLRNLSMCGSKPQILSVVKPYSEVFKCKITDKFPPLFDNLLNEDLVTLTYEELVNHCQSLSFATTEEERVNLEQATRDQSKSKDKLWFKYRTGRVTASHFGPVCKSSPIKPPKKPH